MFLIKIYDLLGYSRMKPNNLILAGLVCLTGFAATLLADPALPKADETWERAYTNRIQWWSLQPIRVAEPPVPKNSSWRLNFIDSFILKRLEEVGLTPAPEADRVVLARRLSFALTGLPPDRETSERFCRDHSPGAFERLVQALLDSPHFGERWARHWMDVVHYSDTHGYEWDAPAKHAWRYRDYLIRAFNSDVPVNSLWLEQIAGDLVEPRLDITGRINESLIGPMALRLGERRHGDNAAAEGVTQEAMANIIDTLGKAFLGTTVACAQCHDHKLDAVAQQDFFSMAGIFMSTRWVVRGVDAVDPNEHIIGSMRSIKRSIRAELSRVWVSSRENLVAMIGGTHSTNSIAPTVPDSLRDFWLRCSTEPIESEAFAAERTRRIQANRDHVRLLADFTQNDTNAHHGWRWDGLGMKHGWVRHGELVIRDEGPELVRHLLPSGRWSHVWSSRMAGAIRSPLFETGKVTTFSVELTAGHHVAQSMIIDQAFHSERMQFLDAPFPTLKTFTAGKFDTLEGGIDQVPRRVYWEIVTKALNNYYPPRTGYGGLKESDLDDERSWFGLSRVYEHPPDKPPLDELERFAPLFESGRDWTNRFADLILGAVTRWQSDAASRADIRLINEALQLAWLTNRLDASAELTRLAADYRALEKQIQPDQTVGSAEEWHEARNERVGVRGSYTELGAEVPRGNLRFLLDPAVAKPVAATAAAQGLSHSSGRLEFARTVIHDHNPLTARVFVNRVWLHLFGEGLVRTPDDFGHLGAQPSHPELLNALAADFIRGGWSLKKLVSTIVTSATWRQDSRQNDRARTIDPENRLWHHHPVRRLDAETIRDSILAVSDTFDPQLYGPPINPHRMAQDAAKRLFSGPLDGLGRRSLYLKMTLMEPPRFLALFNQPIPKFTTGHRDATQVPSQALALLNDPFVQLMAKEWARRLIRSDRDIADNSDPSRRRLERMIAEALGRPALSSETERLVRLLDHLASLRSVSASEIPSHSDLWQDIAHTLFNFHEFIHVY